jgi:hypothetical protein
MIYGIVQWTIISLIIIMLAHHLYFFLKDTLTVPKVKDLVHQPSKSYKEIEDTLTNKSLLINDSNKTVETTEINKTDMKNELKQFFNDLTQNKPGVIPQGDIFSSPNWPPATFNNEVSAKI